MRWEEAETWGDIFIQVEAFPSLSETVFNQERGRGGREGPLIQGLCVKRLETTRPLFRVLPFIVP